jgi:hypothetical protein
MIRVHAVPAENTRNAVLISSYPDMEKLIRFDWAIKKLLRDKANFSVLEGFQYRSVCRM